MIFSIIIIFIFGYLGCRAFTLLKIPGAAVTGSLVALAVISSQGCKLVELNFHLLTFLQIIIGITIGCRFKKEQIAIIKSFLIPGILSSIWMIVISLTIGFIMAKMTGMDLGTALYASIPGGLSEMGLLARSLNLCVPVVTLLQFIRVLSINLSLPLIASSCHNLDKKSKADCQLNNKREPYNKKTKNLNYIKNEKLNIRDIFVLLFFGSLGGFVAKFLNIPVGGMLGSMFVISTLRIIGLPLKELPQWIIQTTQIIIGGYLGTAFVPEVLSTLKSLLIPVMFFSFLVVLNGIIIGIIFHRILKWDLATALLATSAGGVTLMTLTAIEINADPVKVSIVQTLRITIILLIMPTLISRVIFCLF